MQHWIKHVCEPRRLLLAWQGPDPVGDRTRFAVAEIVKDETDYVLRYLSGPEVERAKKLGFAGYPAFRFSQPEHRHGILAAFLRRLPPKTRADFEAYKAQFRLGPGLELSDFALLAYTGARLPSDGFSLVNPLEGLCGPCEFVLEIVGHRHYVHKLKTPPSVGDLLDLVPEPTNRHDSKAIAVRNRGETIGYVNRLQTGPFHGWITEGAIEACIERLNGAADRPRAFMFVSVSDRSDRVAA
jgi:hypothetical protein